MGGYGIGLGGQDSGYGAPEMDPMGRRRGLFAALLGAQQPQQPLSGDGPGGNERTIGAEMPNRIQDDRLSRNSAWGDSQAATPVGTMAGSRGDDTHLRELQGQYEDVGRQIAQPPPRLPLWRRIIGGALAGPATGGILAERQRGEQFQQNQLRERQNTLLQQIEAERRMQEAEQSQTERETAESQRQNVGKTIILQDRVMQWNPATGRYDQDLGPSTIPKPEVHDTDQGPIQFNPQTGQWGPISIGGKPVGPKQQKPDTPEQQDIDYYTSQGMSLPEAIRRAATDRQAPQREPQQLAVTPDGDVIAMRPGMKMPAGTRSASAAEKGPTVDEQRRYDLGNNMNENLTQLEDIVTRRPELFGPYGGRKTRLEQWDNPLNPFAGTKDKDVAALKSIREYLGMASVGAHSMRNAQHVGEAADAVLAGFLNSPEATKAAIETARKSTATFQADVERERGGAYPRQPGAGGQGGKGGGNDLGAAPPGAPEGATVRNKATGQRGRVQNGRIVPLA